MPVTPIFVALFSLMLVVLSMGVVSQRLTKKVSRGDGGERDLEIAMRIQGNFIEYVPLCLLLFWCIEQITFNSRLVFALGCVLLLSRIMHVIGMRYPKPFMPLRKLGILGTFSVLLLGSLNLLWHYLPVSV